jgi:hypothetical protein
MIPKNGVWDGIFKSGIVLASIVTGGTRLQFLFTSEVAMDATFAFELLLIMAFSLFVLGMLTTITGILILTTRVTSKDLRTIASQTSRLAQKGLAEEVAGLVGNASSLLDAMNQLVRTTAGVGVFLTLLGLCMMYAAGWIALKIYS